VIEAMAEDVDLLGRRRDFVPRFEAQLKGVEEVPAD
jgi:hypothetical protein